MTITTSDILQSFLTAIKDLHSTILHMILKKNFFSRVEDYQVERLRILELIFPPIYVVNKTMCAPLSAQRWFLILFARFEKEEIINLFNQSFNFI